MYLLKKLWVLFKAYLVNFLNNNNAIGVMTGSVLRLREPVNM